MPFEPIALTTRDGDIVTVSFHGEFLGFTIKWKGETQTKRYALAIDDWERLVDVVDVITRPPEKSAFP